LRPEDELVNFPLVALCTISVNVFDRFDATKRDVIGLNSDDVACGMSVF
jgi:hypothetical protein